MAFYRVSNGGTTVELGSYTAAYTAETITIGFKPSILHVFLQQEGIQYGVAFDERISPTTYTAFAVSNPRSGNIGTEVGNFTLSLFDSGFILKSTIAGTNTFYYAAIK